MKQFFKFDKHIFPPASAPFRRGLAVGLLFSVLISGIIQAVSWVADRSHDEGLAWIAIGITMLAGWPWTELFPLGFLGMFVGLFVSILINGLILGLVLGVIFKICQSRDA